MKEKTITILYGTFVCLMVLALGIAYANVVTELKIEGNTVGQEQEGVYITNVEYLTNSGADITNSGVNYFLGTMLDSKVVLGSSTSSNITYQVTIKNNTDREQVFIGIIKDETNEEIYSNTNIQPNVATVEEVTGLEEYVSTVAPGEYITFPVTYAYAGTDTSNTELQGKINFRFREVAILELSNENTTYALENVYAGYTPEEYEFTVSNYNETYTNGVPLTYTFETELTEGSPLEAKIYDENGNEITESVVMGGDKNTQEDHKYTLKLIWDESKNEAEHQGKEYACNIKLVATPEDTKYLEHRIEKGFNVDIATNIPPTVTGEVSNITTTTATITATGADENGDTLQYNLVVNGETYGPNTTQTWKVTGLSEATQYTYTITITDGFQSNNFTDEFTTNCSGATMTCNTSYCSGVTPITITCTECNGSKKVSYTCTPSINCSMCNGYGKTYCTNTSIATGIPDYYEQCAGCGAILYPQSCSVCGAESYSCTSTMCTSQYWFRHSYITCNTCNGNKYKCEHGNYSSHTASKTCETCSGNGTISSNGPCIHGLTSPHRYCDHYTNTNVTSHTYCSHGKTSQHDS